MQSHQHLHGLSVAIKKLHSLIDNLNIQELSDDETTLLTHLKNFLFNLPVVPSNYMDFGILNLDELINHWLDEATPEFKKNLIITRREVLEAKIETKVPGVLQTINIWSEQNRNIPITLTSQIQIERPKTNFLTLKEPDSFFLRMKETINAVGVKFTSSTNRLLHIREIDYLFAAIAHNATSSILLTIPPEIFTLILRCVHYSDLGTIRLTSRQSFLTVSSTPDLQKKYYDQQYYNQDKKNKFIFFAKDIANTMYSVQAHADNTIADLQEAFSEEMNVGPSMLRFIFANKLRLESETLKNCNIGKESTVNMVLKLSGD